MDSSENRDDSTRDGPARVSVIICAFTEDRWELLNESLRSVVAQDQAAFEVFLCIDHNPEMFDRCVAEMSTIDDGVAWTLQIVQNRFDTRLGGARTTAAELATGEILVFLSMTMPRRHPRATNAHEALEDPNIVAGRRRTGRSLSKRTTALASIRVQLDIRLRLSWTS